MRGTQPPFVHRPRAKRAGFAAVAAALSLVLLLLCPGCKPKPTQAAGTAPVEVGVVTVAPVTAPVRWEFIGVTEPFKTVDLRSQVSGVLIKRSFVEGKPVKQGDVLFEIDPKPFQANLDAAKGRLAQARARLANAQRNAKRLKTLRDQGGGSIQEYEDAVSEQDQAAAAVQSAQAEVTRWELELGYATIRSPLTGVIGKSAYDEGAYVTAGPSGLLATASQQDPIYVSFTISEREVFAIRDQVKAGTLVKPADPNQSVEVVLSDGSTYAKRGKLNFIDVAIDRNTGTALIRAEIPNPDQLLYPGQFVKPRVVGYTRPNSIAVPQRAVQISPAGAFVYIVGAGDKVEQRVVTPGPWSGNDWVIEKGLNAGDRVVIEGVQRVAPGLTVKVGAAPTTAPSTAPSVASAVR